MSLLYCEHKGMKGVQLRQKNAAQAEKTGVHGQAVVLCLQSVLLL